MLSRKLAAVEQIEPSLSYYAGGEPGVQNIRTEFGTAVNFIELAGTLSVGDVVLLNRTANDLGLGTGGDDFVIARISPPPEETSPARREIAHIMRLRYTPLQHSEAVVEDMPELGDIWDKRLDSMPVVAGELHSQLAAVAASVTTLQGDLRVCPVVTDAAALPVSYGRLMAELRKHKLILPGIAVGQAFNADWLAVTVHNALLWVRHTNHTVSCAFVCQGPGNTGTNTKYGFSGIEQASNLDIAAALGGTPIACVRASSGDARERHQGISHHTRTVLELVRSRCIVPVPEDLEPDANWLERHEVRIVPRDKTQPALDLLKERGIDVTTMGRTIDEDPLFFHAAAAAGVVAADIASEQLKQAERV